MTITRISRHTLIKPIDYFGPFLSLHCDSYGNCFEEAGYADFRRRGSKKIIIFIVHKLIGLKEYNYPHKQRYVTHIFVACSCVCQPWSFASYSCSTRLEKIRVVCEAFQLVMYMKTTGKVKHDFLGMKMKRNDNKTTLKEA